MTKPRWASLLVLVAVMAVAGSLAVRQNAITAVPAAAPAPAGSQPAASQPAAHPATWATPMDRPGLPNLHQVSATLYRGAQPTEEGFRQLKQMGIKTVLNVRDDYTDEGLPEAAGLAYEAIPMTGEHAEDVDIVQVLRLLTDKDKTPVFVHCHYGADRTGMICAAYRVVVQGWPKADALREMQLGGFHFNPKWQNIVGFIHDLDVETVRRQLRTSGSAATLPTR